MFIYDVHPSFQASSGARLNLAESGGVIRQTRNMLTPAQVFTNNLSHTLSLQNHSDPHNESLFHLNTGGSKENINQF